MKKWLIRKFKEYSKPLRHDIVHFLAPKLTHPISLLPRPMIEYMASQGMFGLVGAEIGVQHGEHAESIFKLLHPKKLFLIDPYLPYFEDGVTKNPASSEVNAHERLKEYGSKAIWIKERSPEALEKLPMLDFCYIDGCHLYPFVKKDLWSAWTKIKKGGILGGHDFCADYIGVCESVLEFTYHNQLEFFGRKADYWIVKP